MSSQLRRRRYVAPLALVLAAAGVTGNQTANAGHRSHHRHRGQTVPCEPCQADPCAPSAAPVEMLPEMAAPPQADQQLIDPSVESPLAPSAIPAPLDTDFAPSFDPAAGLATSFGAGGAGALAYAAPGYIEPAQIATRVRVRYDNAQNANRVTRAGFLYPAPFENFTFDYEGGRGPSYGSGADPIIDSEVLSVYAEWAFRDRLSLFIDVPFRFINPVDVRETFNAANGNFNGIDDESGLTQRGGGDVSAGIRWGWIESPDEHLTLQVRVTVPSGEARRALGTGNTSIDVGLLYDQQIGSRTRFYAELNDWQTLDAVTLRNAGSTFPPGLLDQNANILRYGAGLGYDVLSCGSRCEPRVLTALFECVGWTVLDGNTPEIGGTAPAIVDATGDTIVNGKYGVRYTHGVSSIYVGYGHNWTSDRWYSDLFRLEWMRNF